MDSVVEARSAYGPVGKEAVDELASIDYSAEKASFLAQAGNVSSVHTRKAYASALERLEPLRLATESPF